MPRTCTDDLTFKRKLFFYLLLIAPGLSLLRLSLVVSGGYSSLQCMSISLQRLLLLQSTGSRVRGLSSCNSGALEHKLSSFGTWGLVAPRHMKSSWTRDGTCVPYLGRQSLIRCATRAVHELTS